MKICLILDRLRSAHNTGNIFRIAEALGAEIIACGYTPAPPHPKLAKTAMGADRMVRCRTMPDAAGAVRLLRTEGYAMILAAEPGPAFLPRRWPRSTAWSGCRCSEKKRRSMSATRRRPFFMRSPPRPNTE